MLEASAKNHICLAKSVNRELLASRIERLSWTNEQTGSGSEYSV
jgi:hypothetical protein